MAKQRRDKSRVLFSIPSEATDAPPPATQIPPLIFGTTTSPQSPNPSLTVPLLPQNVINNIVDHLHDRTADLRACSLVSKSWKSRSQWHLFREIQWTTETVSGWCKHIPPRSDGLAGHTMGLMVISLLEQDRLTPIKDHFTSFHNITSLTLQDLDFDDPLFDPSKVPVYFGHLKAGLTSLTLINLNGSCGRLLSFISFFPRLEYLAVFCPGELIPPDPTINLEYRPIRGTLFLRGHLNRQTSFIKLLSGTPLLQCNTIRLEHWGMMRVEDFNSLLASCAESLEILGLSACKDELSSRLRPNFGLCSRLTELSVQLRHIGAYPPNLLNIVLTSPVVLSRITFVVHGRVEPEDIVPFATIWTETDVMIAQFSTKLFRRNGGKRLLLTFRAIRALDFTPLIPHSVKRGVEVVVERGDDKGLTSLSCVSCEMEQYNLI